MNEFETGTTHWESEEIQADEVSGQAPEVQSTLDPNDDLADQILEAHNRAAIQQQQEEAEDEELITSARLRLEQGKLYEMLLKHNLFGDVDADPRAVANVQREIKNFIKERLEILLGLKPDPRLQPVVSQVQAVGQFTDLEVDLLKRFLAKLSKGATSVVSSPVPKAPQVINPIRSTKTEGIRPVSTGVRVASPKNSVPEPSSQLKFDNESVKKQLEALGENEMPLGKPISKVKRSELMERNRRIAQRQAARKAQSLNRMPTPDPATEASIMMGQVMARNESLQNAGPGATSLKLAIGHALNTANK